VLDARLARREGGVEALELGRAPVQPRGTRDELVLLVVHELPAVPARRAGELEVVQVRLDRRRLVVERLHALLVLLREREQVLHGALLRHDLLDDLVHVRDARRLLDLPERVLEDVDAHLGLVRRPRLLVRLQQRRPERALALLVQVLSVLLRDLLPLLAPPLGALLVLLPHLDQLVPLPQLALPPPPLLLVAPPHLIQLLLRNLPRVVGVAGQEQQLLAVPLLGGKGALQGGELVVEPHPLLLQTVHDLRAHGCKRVSQVTGRGRVRARIKLAAAATTNSFVVRAERSGGRSGRARE
jgi:hypothetical protein